MSLASLGLNEFEEYLYRALLRDPGVALDGESGAVEAAITRLASLDLVHLDEDGRLTAVDPEVGIARLIRSRADEANAELRRITTAWHDLPSLAAERSQGGNGRVESIERIDDHALVGQRLWGMAVDAREVLAVHANPNRKAATSALPRYLQLLEGKVNWRTIIHRQSLSDAGTVAYVTRLHRAGDRHRFTDNPVQELVILDRSTAFVSTTPNVRGAGAFMIRQPGVVATLVDLFEQAWERAIDLEPDGEPHLTPTQRQVLSLLSQMGKDEIAAREMGVSLRTYRRHVAELLVRLGAANRFQAALLAKEHGWI